MRKAPPVDRRLRRQNGLYILLTVALSLAILANMVMIFCLSAEDAGDSGDRSEGVTDAVVDIVYPDLEQKPAYEQESIFNQMHHLVRKLAHFSEFALLGFLSALLCLHIRRRAPRLRLWLTWLIPAVFTLLYAASDEFHQRFTGRGAAVKDVFIDFAGALFGILAAQLLVLLVVTLIRRFRTRDERRARRLAGKQARRDRRLAKRAKGKETA